MENTAMEMDTPKPAPILEIAWQRHADLDIAADKRTRRFYDIRRWIAVLGILTTLFVILTQQFFIDLENPPQIFASFPYYATIGLVVKVLFIGIPLVASIFTAFANVFFSNRDWFYYRAGAEEIKKEIYLYRTVLKNDPGRHRILRKRLAQIQRQLSSTLKEEFSLEEYKGSLPSNYRKGDPNSDPGFHDLIGDEYLKYRLKHQLDWHHRKVNQRKHERLSMNIAILVVGGLGSLLAALGGFLAIWVAFTALINATLLGWQQLRKVDETIKNYSKVVLDLTLLYDWWQNLEPEERTERSLNKLVMECEKVLSAQNIEYTRLLHEVTTNVDIEEEDDLTKDEMDRYGELSTNN
jgi:hypothetical protein